MCFITVAWWRGSRVSVGHRVTRSAGSHFVKSESQAFVLKHALQITMCNTRRHRVQFTLITVVVGMLTLLFASNAVCNEIIASQCVLQLQVLDEFYVGDGDGIEPEIMVCECGCPEDKVKEQHWRKSHHLKRHCEERLASKHGQCVEKLLPITYEAVCPQGGFAHCLIDLKTKATYDVKIVNLSKISIRLVTDKNRHFDLALDEKSFNCKSHKCKLIGLGCEKFPGQYFMYFKNIRGGKDAWLEAFQYTQDNIKSLKEQSFVLNDDKENEKIHLSMLDFTDDVCNNKKKSPTSLTFNSMLLLHGRGRKILPHVITKYEMINSSVLNVFYHSKPVIKIGREIVSNSKPPSVPTLTTATTLPPKQTDIASNESLHVSIPKQSVLNNGVVKFNQKQIHHTILLIVWYFWY